jgi:uncharacterized membrane protein
MPPDAIAPPPSIKDAVREQLAGLAQRQAAGTARGPQKGGVVKPSTVLSTVIIVCVLVLLAPMFRAATGSASARRAAAQAASAPQAALYSEITGTYNTVPGYKARYGAKQKP